MQGKTQPEKLEGLIEDAKSYLSTMIDRFPNYYPFQAAQTAIGRMEEIIHHPLRISQRPLMCYDIGLLTAKSIDQDFNQYDCKNPLVLHQLSFEFLKRFFPQLLPPAGTDGANGNIYWTLAFNFYQEQEYPQEKIYSHLRGIDFTKIIERYNHPSNYMLQQWQLINAPQGDYYSEENVEPTLLGINPCATSENREISYKQAVRYRVTNNIEVLKSIAASVIDFWSIPAVLYQTTGGEVQYFTSSKDRYLERVDG